MNGLLSIHRYVIDTVLERWRVNVPPPFFLGFVTLICGLPFALTFLPFSPLPANVILVMIPLIPVGAAVGITVIFGFFWLLGYVTGYRDFVHRWESLPTTELEELTSRFRSAAAEHGFKIVWSRGDRGLVALKGLEMELAGTPFYSAKQFPMRLSLLYKKTDDCTLCATLKMQARSYVVINTGERQRCQEEGERILAALGVDDNPASQGQPTLLCEV